MALVFLLAIPWLAVYSTYRFFRGHWLRFRFRRDPRSRGKRIIFVYSESPNWQGYIEAEILPKLAPLAVTLNYSKRSEWKTAKPLEAKIWEHWGGEIDFNPVAIVIPERGKVKTVRFFKAFRDFKHGKDGPLREKERELLDQVAALRAGA